ncbi:MAG: lytic murein transglycosylase [Rhodospirillales bacterium]
MPYGSGKKKRGLITPEDYEPLVGAENVERILSKADNLRGRHVVHVSSTLSFLAYAVDFDGDGRKDIWNSKEDVFASAANYLSRSGWRKDQTWGRPVKLPQLFDLNLVDLKLQKRLSEWQRMGVRNANGADLPKRDLMASVVLAEGPAGPAFVVYDNYRTILKWNRSTFFAVAVGSLADRIGGG